MDKKVIRAKIELMLTSPFWGSLITRLELKDWDGNTFATNGKDLLVPDIKYFSDWTFQQIIGVLAHETWHCAGGHIFRMHNRNQMLWNVAADFATNDLLTKNTFQLPKGVLLDKKYEGMTAEKIYALIPQDSRQTCPRDLQDPQSGDKDDKDKNKKGKSSKGDKNKDQGDAIPTDVDPKELEQDWKEAVTSAARIAVGRGNMPAGLEEYINEVLFPKVPWQEVLYHYLQTAKGNTDYTMYPFNRKHLWREMYLPSLKGEMIELNCCVDSSGSIDHDDLVRYFSELRGICTIFGSYVIHLFIGDTQVNKYETITEDSEFPKFVQGRGGTDFRPFFKQIEDEGLNDFPIVYFTDLDGAFPKSHDGDGVFWLIRKNQNQYKHEVPFGRIIVIDD